MESNRQSAYQEERHHLERTLTVLESQLKELEAIPRYYGTDFNEQALESARQASREKLAKGMLEPYFGRLDFKEDGHAQSQSLYIGKAGTENRETGQPLVIDWRAPVASLFYSFTGGDGPASYLSPDGPVEGIVHLKRNLVVRRQELLRVVDTYVRGSTNVAVTDEFLLYRLSENKDHRLRDIVSTIQSEQDQIIRSPKNTALVIQGVAGSGKTTVALHRLAYLLYQYRENIRAERMIIFAPNRMFLDYISGVLPELGVGDIQQTTFTDWALELLDNEVSPADPAPALAYWFAAGPERPAIHQQVPGLYKGSIAFKQLVDDMLQHYEANAVPEHNYEPWPGSLLPAATIRQWYYVDNRHEPLAKRRERTLARIKRWQEMELDRLWEAEVKKDYKKKANAKWRAYAKAWTELTPLTFYSQLFNPAKRTVDFPQSLLDRIPRSVAESTSRTLKKKQVMWEDLAPLVYIHHRFHGLSGRRFDHVVIDEAQDFSPFQVELLRLHTPGDSFTILGDLAQGIHSYQGIDRWDDFTALFPEDRTAFYRLDRSYRSTMEIIHFANAVLSASDRVFTPAIPVFRSGEKVKLSNVPSGKTISSVQQIVARIRDGSSETTAIIARTAKRAAEIHAALDTVGIEAALIEADKTEYKGGISILPVYLAKGLEFDAVLLLDIDSFHYDRGEQDAKLLYVGATRALHELWVLYEGEASPLLQRMNEDFVEYVHP
ncbi:UvrD-helicase domain-containing protein [Paenibacillus sp. J2TS4]|uniref:HelD family protein n=1 Tax=Paenibacillus sp. J2TS4 TaxID=2807194 RepID=UPI001B13F4E9|nr:UvrD-helicase domain-containing protein [Paenibacillus sp. J2TS4]GIP34782.1 DNA helicase [Paenibacillus sp. J2TS4]